MEVIVTPFVVIPSVYGSSWFPEYHTIDRWEEALSHEENGVLVGLRNFWGLLEMCQEALAMKAKFRIFTITWLDQTGICQSHGYLCVVSKWDALEEGAGVIQ